MKKTVCACLVLLFLVLLASSCGSVEDKKAYKDWLWFTANDQHFFINISDAVEGKETVVPVSAFDRKVIDVKGAGSLYPQKISDDGSKVFYGSKPSDGGVQSLYYDLAARRIMTEAEAEAFQTSMGPVIFHAYGEPETYRQKDGTISTLHLDLNDQVKGSLYRMIYSPDRSQFAYQGEDADHVKYLLIYDLAKNAIIDHVKIGKDLSERNCSFYISQWYPPHTILLTNNHEAYRYDPDMKKLETIGKYLFYPNLTADGKYLVYSKPSGAVSEDEALAQLPDYGETGLFIVENKPGAEPHKIIVQDVNQISDQDMLPRQMLHTKIPFELGDVNNTNPQAEAAIYRFLNTFIDAVKSGDPNQLDSRLNLEPKLYAHMSSLVKKTYANGILYRVSLQDVRFGEETNQDNRWVVHFKVKLTRDSKGKTDQVELNSTATLQEESDGSMRWVKLEKFLK
ncbi:TcaA NTF2-like domain-containing protein [Gorillibacterium massiliense]|uniref:TcaA NTF2-like domain-containing protein n=1 Tax=Gorillibacterium massiliense TaxID=1280390 RepID=UPI0004AE0E7B|nr:hypothetical protein [Gorillibacterium massiliense]